MSGTGPDPRRRRLNELYLQELDYFRAAQIEYAARFPEMEALARRGADPSVERLLEGAAFLNAAVRVRFEDEQVELSQDLLRMLLPQATRPIPSLVIQRFVPPAREIQARVIERGAEVVWTPPNASGLNASCRFRTTASVLVPPFSLEDAQVLPDRATVQLKFRLPAGLPAAQLDGRPLRAVRLYIDGEDSVAHTLLMYLCKRLRTDRPVSLRSVDGRSVVPLPPPVLVGFDAEESLLPGWEAVHGGYRLLFEYLTYPERFRFVEILGLDALPILGPEEAFVVEFPFDQPFPFSIKPSNFVLGCAPAVNLFAQSSEPFERETGTDEYPLRPAVGVAGSEMVLFSVESLSAAAFDQRTSQRVGYRPLLEVAAGGEVVHEQAVHWYLERLRPRPRDDGGETWVVLSPLDGAVRHTLRAELLVCNGRAVGAIQLGMLNSPQSGVPQGFRTENITLPTPYVGPPVLGRRLAARVVGGIALGRSTLSTREGLARWFDALDMRALADEATRRLHQGWWGAIRQVDAQMKDERVEADARSVGQAGSWSTEVLVRGVELSLDVQFNGFGAGGAFLFGAVLERILPLHASLGTFTRLVLHDIDTNGTLDWAPRLGHRPLL